MAPLVIGLAGSEMHSGITSWVPHRLGREGFAYATIGYRVEGRLTLAAALADIVKAIVELRANHEKGRFDPNRILLLGSGTGAQIATLIGTDPAYLREAGIPFEAVRAVATIDGVGFDIPYTLASAPRHLRSDYKRLFGPNPEEHRRLSPVSHLAPSNAPRFLLLAVEDEKRLRDQSQRAAQAFGAAGIDARFEALPKWREGVLSTYLLANPGASGQTLVDFFKSAAAGPS